MGHTRFPPEIINIIFEEYIRHVHLQCPSSWWHMDYFHHLKKSLSFQWLLLSLPTPESHWPFTDYTVLPFIRYYSLYLQSSKMQSLRISFHFEIKYICVFYGVIIHLTLIQSNTLFYSVNVRQFFIHLYWRTFLFETELLCSFWACTATSSYRSE